MAASDLDAVALIEKQHESAWSGQAIREELQRDDAIALVICTEAGVAGWGCCRYHGTEAELLKLGISPAYKRCGFGSMLFDNLLSLLRSRRVDTLFLEVRSTNRAARSFYLSRGFTDAGRRINYYRQPTDDAVMMKKNVRLEKGNE